MNGAEQIQGFDLKNFRAAVIGCGGLGCNIAVHLAGSGIGELILCDFDIVSKSNLNRQFLYTVADLGKKKTDIAKKRLSDFNPDIEIKSHNIKISSPEELYFVKHCDIIFLAVDNNEARRTVSAFCAEQGIALVNGGINGFFGTAYLYVPGKTPCPDCAQSFESDYGVFASVSSTAGIVGSLCAELGIRYLLDNNSCSAGCLHIYDNTGIEKLIIKSIPGCEICGRVKRKEK